MLELEMYEKIVCINTRCKGLNGEIKTKISKRTFWGRNMKDFSITFKYIDFFKSIQRL